MPYQEMPQFKATELQSLEIPQPGIGGLNLKDLEFEQEVNQSPHMLNMMYRGGAFGKRYGQEVHLTCKHEETEDEETVTANDTVYAMTTYFDDLIVHAGTSIKEYKSDGTVVTVGTGFTAQKGLFITYAQKLYYLTSNGFYVLEYDSDLETDVFNTADYYIPNFIVNCRPDGTGENESGTVQDSLNLIGRQFKYLYNATGTDTIYIVGTYDEDDLIDWEEEITVVVDDTTYEADDDATIEGDVVTWSAGATDESYFVDAENKRIIFKTAPAEGDLNVEMTFTMDSNKMTEERDQIFSCKYYETFGGSSNSRLFLGGGGGSKYYYSDAYDISYFPADNYATLGNTEEDITGFGRQYNVLIIFKPKEVYSLYSYTETASTTLSEEKIGMEGFRSQLVNPRIGCDAPHSIQLINNLLTWFNSKEGVCTLVSTNIQDERNVRLISRNIERTNAMGTKGILDVIEDPSNIQSVDFDNKYFICFPTSGTCYIWDYEISPYTFTSRGETPPKQLDWFIFDHFNVGQFLKYEKDLIYSCTKTGFTHKIMVLNNSFYDNFYTDEEREEHKTDPDKEKYNPQAIGAYYMTPFLQFNAVEYLKNVKNIYIQSRGDTASLIDIYYYTDESGEPDHDAEPIKIGGKIWQHFLWESFTWTMNNWAIVYRRKCSLKKIQMASFFFKNEEAGRDLSLAHIALQYQIVKNIK